MQVKSFGLNDNQLKFKDTHLVFRKEIQIPYKEIKEIKYSRDLTIVSTYYIDLRMKLSKEKYEQLLERVREWKNK